MNKIFICYLAWNLFVMLLFGFDKFCAVKKTRRVSERTLIECSFFMGGFGAFLGMVVFHHKTAKFNFKLAVPAACVLNAVILGVLAGKIM